MPRAPKVGFYAVARGHVPGIYDTWDECQHQIVGFPGNKHKKFATIDQANAYLAEHGVSFSAASVPASSSSSTRPPRAAKPYARPSSSTQQSSSDTQQSSSSSKWSALTNEIVHDESGWSIVYSDGACKGNGKIGSVAGVGVWWGQNDPRNLAERCPGTQTNNRAELIAITRALETTPYTKQPLLIKTDSKYSISCFRVWMPRWLASNFVAATGQPVKNAPLIRYLSALLDARARRGQKVHLQYVKGHAGEEGNEGADQLANYGATLPPMPERDWTALTAAVEAAHDQLLAKPAQTMQMPQTGGAQSQSELQAYADCLLDSAELLAELKHSIRTG